MTVPARLTAEPAALDDLISQLEGALAVARALKAERDAIEAAEAEGQEFPDHDLIDVSTAAIRFREKPDTLRHWAEHEGLGIKRGGRWLVSASRLRKRQGY
ncbi:hypothetical protein EN817_03815 [Mesorhizobium sp. M3A.F.Ca.ET.174.01.1.1]|uniref:hypothetical protein n=1 Tax=unclassified Mesorhizobium TaxID=325217 RepID=UPI001093A655|nr:MULTISPECIES: hypothetical protein [unclassified Mesorhizobium]TGS89477.1 hypothetical protein EN818_03815 [Mesorhizobium sp. M3A.F.Ca.ET.175.01.1.1]TGT31250.1 hypothetical protein EN817_03815 [Mesorhizobium sp. M3A.F.Ca.ET.174.01.1.1]